LHSFFGAQFDPTKPDFGRTDLDPLQALYRWVIVYFIEQQARNLSLTDNHGTNGMSLCDTWPNASSTSHQQMHISWIHRAWQGGLRLMIASVTENQLLSRLWHQRVGDGYPDPNPDLEFSSALLQIQFIKNQAQANSDWMQVVTTPDEAEEAISNNKLAVILGVEMDSLSADQIIQLTAYDVRQVVPIHLANSLFGGMAIYDCNFNTNSWYLHGGKCSTPMDDHQCNLFLQVYQDPTLGFKLNQPNYLVQVTPADNIVLSFLPLGTLIPPGAIVPLPVSNDDYSGLAYANPPLPPDTPPGTPPPPGTQWGHRNRLGVDTGQLQKLMKAGLIIDLAHMSDQSQMEALNFADRYGYPLVNTHTCMRPDGWRDGDTSERDIRQSLVGEIAKHAGVMGLGTAGYRDKSKTPIPDQLGRWIENYLDAWSAMNFHGVAIGTDTNGLSPQIPNAVQDPKVNFKAGSEEVPVPCMVGNREFHFGKDGIAHYGMLADFIQALRQYDDRGADIADYFLCRTAEETITMWRGVVQAANKM
jgi:microsomal dipeptidase-like Zn-dependent dipeptidase